jgi:hypothetical protein
MTTDVYFNRPATLTRRERFELGMDLTAAPTDHREVRLTKGAHVSMDPRRQARLEARTDLSLAEKVYDFARHTSTDLLSAGNAVGVLD